MSIIVIEGVLYVAFLATGAALLYLALVQFTPAGVPGSSCSFLITTTLVQYQMARRWKGRMSRTTGITISVIQLPKP